MISFILVTLVYEAVEGCLLHDRWNSNVRDAKEDGVDDDEGLSEGVRHGQEGDIHQFSSEQSLLLNDVDGGIDVILCC